MKRNKILFISRAYGEHAGGMERLSYELISHFPDAEKIVPPSRKYSSLFASRVSAIIFALTIIPRAIIRARHADIIHIGDPVLLVVAWCIKVIYNKPVICTVHGLDLTFSNSLYQRYLKIFLPSCTQFIAISDYAKTLLEQKGVQQKITIIPPGVTDRNYDSSISRKNLEELLNQDINNKIIFATTGRLVQRKGHAWFIEKVLPYLPENIFYTIAGDGPEREHISNIIIKNNLQDRVLMLGRISDADQKVLLNTCDAFIQPNIAVQNDHEGFGIAPLEAALCARNVFASNIDGIPSAIIDNKNGTLLPAEDSQAWIQVLTEYSKYPALNMQAREYTKKEFNWDAISAKYRELFNFEMLK